MLLVDRIGPRKKTTEHRALLVSIPAQKDLQTAITYHRVMSHVPSDNGKDWFADNFYFSSGKGLQKNFLCQPFFFLHCANNIFTFLHAV